MPLLVSKASAKPTMTLNGTPLAFGSDFTLRGSSVRATVDVTAPVVFAGYGVVDANTGREFVKVDYLIAKTLADAPDRPHWVKGDYFGTLYKGPVAT